MPVYEATPFTIRELDSNKLFTVDETTAPIIRKKGLDMQLRPVFEITFIGRDANAEKESK